MYSEDKLDYLLKIYNERSVGDYKKIGMEIVGILGIHCECLRGRLGEYSLKCEFKKEDGMRVGPELRLELGGLDVEEGRLKEICGEGLVGGGGSEKGGLGRKEEFGASTGRDPRKQSFEQSGIEKVEASKLSVVVSKKSVAVREKKENKWEMTKPQEPLFAKPETKSTKEHTRVGSTVTAVTMISKPKLVRSESIPDAIVDTQSQPEMVPAGKSDGDIKFQENYNEFCQNDRLQESIDYEPKYNFQEKATPARVVEVKMMAATAYPQSFIKAQNQRSKEDSLRRFQKTCNDYKGTQPFGTTANELDRRVERLVGKFLGKPIKISFR